MKDSGPASTDASQGGQAGLTKTEIDLSRFNRDKSMTIQLFIVHFTLSIIH